MKALVRTALDAAIKEACGLTPAIQQSAQRHYVDAVALIRELGFVCSLPDEIATKQDITDFLKIPTSTLNNFLRKHKDNIKPIRLDTASIRAMGSRANRLNGYRLDDVAKMACGLDTPLGLELKQRMFGQYGAFARPETRAEIEWREVFAEVFRGFDLRCNFRIGRYKVDWFVPAFSLVLECNGFDCHKYYDAAAEEARERVITQHYAYGLVRFHHKIRLERLCNAILRARPGKIIRLYDAEAVGG